MIRVWGLLTHRPPGQTSWCRALVLGNNDIVLGSSGVITRHFMSSGNISRAECALAASLADLLATLQASNLPERRKQEIASAIRTAARALGRPPEDIPAEARLLASRLKEVVPAAIGISRGRWNNVRALLRAALALIQPISPGRHRNGLLPEWLALSNELTSRSDKIALSRMLHFCSAQGIGPNAVTAGNFDEYRLHLARSLLKRPNETFAMTVRAMAEGGSGDRGLATGRRLDP
jgi:hypothetical protein